MDTRTPHIINAIRSLCTNKATVVNSGNKTKEKIDKYWIKTRMSFVTYVCMDDILNK